MVALMFTEPMVGQKVPDGVTILGTGGGTTEISTDAVSLQLLLLPITVYVVVDIGVTVWLLWAESP